MPKSKTHFEQVPVEIAEKAAKAESNGHSADPLQRPRKKSANGNAAAEATRFEDKAV